MKNKIAVTIQNYVQFYSLKALLDLKDKYDIDIYVPSDTNDKLGYRGMYDDIYNYLKDNNYKVYRSVKNNINYKVLLEPYSMDWCLNIKHKYRMKYMYGFMCAKPKPVYRPDLNIQFDAILCHGVYEEEVLSAYSKTYLVGKLNYIDYKHEKTKKEKKTLLYLPTYGNVNSISDIAVELAKLSDSYEIITKEHHGTNYLENESSKSKLLSKCISKFYDSSYPLDKLLEIADVVLSDNSAAIFEAIYTKVPVCIFSKNLKDCSLDKIDSIQYQLIKKGIIPYTNKDSELRKIIGDALSSDYKNKQSKYSDEQFPIRGKDILKSFTDVIDIYLNDDINSDFYYMHRMLKDNYNDLVKEKEKYYIILEEKNKMEIELKNIQEEKSNLINEINRINQEYANYRAGKLHRMADKIYNIKQKKKKKVDKTDK